MKLLRKVVILLILITLGSYYMFTLLYDELQSPPTQDATPVPVDENELINRYIYGVNYCLIVNTDRMTSLQPLKAFEEKQSQYENGTTSPNVSFINAGVWLYWRKLPALVDQCSVNPQMSLRTYPTNMQFNIFYVQNMKKNQEQVTCNIVSVHNERYAESEQLLRNENEDCNFFAISKSYTTKKIGRVSQLSLNIIPDGRSKEQEGSPPSIFLSDFLNKIGGIIDLIIIGPTEHSNEFAQLFLKGPNTLNNITVCQVNLLYREPSIRNVSQFNDVYSRSVLQESLLPNVYV
uniref:Exostosin domain-containing protein n=1 Tax=Heterorhabditis bacteriophora TaxID=37862 RepID=A0A1I7X7Z7_HETBA